MTWTKITDTLPDDPRLLQVPREVRWMYLEGPVWCNTHATDGLIPFHAIRRVTDQEDPKEAARQLVRAGLRRPCARLRRARLLRYASWRAIAMDRWAATRRRPIRQRCPGDSARRSGGQLMGRRPRPERGWLYQIEVHVQTLAEWYGGDDPDPEDRDEFKARTHSCVIIRHAVIDPDAGYTAQKILDSHRWAAGLIARYSAYFLQDRIMARGRNHGCAPSWGQTGEHLYRMGEWCGRSFEKGIVLPSSEVPPCVEYDVIPADAKKFWFRRSISNLIVADQRPEPTPARQPDHPNVALREPHTVEQEQPR